MSEVHVPPISHNRVDTDCESREKRKRQEYENKRDIAVRALASHSFEPYVDADRVACYLGIERRQVLEKTRSGVLPGHPVDPTAKRKEWRFKLTEVDFALTSRKPVRSVDDLAGADASPHNVHGSPRSRRG